MTSQRTGRPGVSISALGGRLPALAAIFLIGAVVLVGQMQPLWAQLTLSTIRGTVTDASGAVVPGVDVTVTDLSTNIPRSTVTDVVGNFEISDLKSGTYRLTAQLPGFKTYVADNLRLE